MSQWCVLERDRPCSTDPPAEIDGIALDRLEPCFVVPVRNVIREEKTGIVREGVSSSSVRERNFGVA